MNNIQFSFFCSMFIYVCRIVILFLFTSSKSIHLLIYQSMYVFSDFLFFFLHSPFFLCLLLFFLSFSYICSSSLSSFPLSFFLPSSPQSMEPFSQSHSPLTLSVQLSYVYQILNDDTTQIKSEPTDINENETDAIGITSTENSLEKSSDLKPLLLPPRADKNDVPIVEWWDEIFLSKENREIRKKAAITSSFKYSGLGIGGKKGDGSGGEISSSSSSSSSSRNVDLFDGAGIYNVRTHM